MTTTVESAHRTPVALGGARGGPDVPTLRQDRWWVQPVVTVTVLTAFVVYATWAAFVNKNYYVGAALHRDLISPFYSPCLTDSCVPGSHPPACGHRLVDDLAGPADPHLPARLPAHLLLLPQGLLPVLLAGRRRPARVADAHGSYTGETRFPLILQNVHRYFFLILPHLQRRS